MEQKLIQSVPEEVIRKIDRLTYEELVTSIYMDFDVDFTVTQGMTRKALENLYKNLYKRRG